MTLSESAIVMISCYFDHKRRKLRTDVPHLNLVSESLISNLDKSAETDGRTLFTNQVFRQVPMF